MSFADLVAAADRAAQKLLGGVAVVYQPAAGAMVTVTGIFDDQYRLMTGEGGEAGVEQVMPAVVLRLEDLPVDPDDDDPTLTIGGIAYSVRERQRDDTGGAIRLLLRRA